MSGKFRSRRAHRQETPLKNRSTTPASVPINTFVDPYVRLGDTSGGGEASRNLFSNNLLMSGNVNNFDIDGFGNMSSDEEDAPNAIFNLHGNPELDKSSYRSQEPDFSRVPARATTQPNNTTGITAAHLITNEQQIKCPTVTSGIMSRFVPAFSPDLFSQKTSADFISHPPLFASDRIVMNQQNLSSKTPPSSITVGEPIRGNSSTATMHLSAEHMNEGCVNVEEQNEPPRFGKPIPVWTGAPTGARTTCFVQPNIHSANFSRQAPFPALRFDSITGRCYTVKHGSGGGNDKSLPTLWDNIIAPPIFQRPYGAPPRFPMPYRAPPRFTMPNTAPPRFMVPNVNPSRFPAPQVYNFCEPPGESSLASGNFGNNLNSGPGLMKMISSGQVVGGDKNLSERQNANTPQEGGKPIISTSKLDRDDRFPQKQNLSVGSELRSRGDDGTAARGGSYDRRRQQSQSGTRENKSASVSRRDEGVDTRQGGISRSPIIGRNSLRSRSRTRENQSTSVSRRDEILCARQRARNRSPYVERNHPRLRSRSRENQSASVSRRDEGSGARQRARSRSPIVGRSSLRSRSRTRENQSTSVSRRDEGLCARQRARSRSPHVNRKRLRSRSGTPESQGASLSGRKERVDARSRTQTVDRNHPRSRSRTRENQSAGVSLRNEGARQQASSRSPIADRIRLRSQSRTQESRSTSVSRWKEEVVAREEGRSRSPTFDRYRPRSRSGTIDYRSTSISSLDGVLGARQRAISRSPNADRNRLRSRSGTQENRSISASCWNEGFSASQFERSMSPNDDRNSLRSRSRSTSVSRRYERLGARQRASSRSPNVYKYRPRSQSGTRENRSTSVSSLDGVLGTRQRASSRSPNVDIYQPRSPSGAREHRSLSASSLGEVHGVRQRISSMSPKVDRYHQRSQSRTREHRSPSVSSLDGVHGTRERATSRSPKLDRYRPCPQSGTRENRSTSVSRQNEELEARHQGRSRSPNVDRNRLYSRYGTREIESTSANCRDGGVSARKRVRSRSPNFDRRRLRSRSSDRTDRGRLLISRDHRHPRGRSSERRLSASEAIRPNIATSLENLSRESSRERLVGEEANTRNDGDREDHLERLPRAQLTPRRERGSTTRRSRSISRSRLPRRLQSPTRIGRYATGEGDRFSRRSSPRLSRKRSSDRVSDRSRNTRPRVDGNRSPKIYSQSTSGGQHSTSPNHFPSLAPELNDQVHTSWDELATGSRSNKAPSLPILVSDSEDSVQNDAAALANLAPVGNITSSTAEAKPTICKPADDQASDDVLCDASVTANPSSSVIEKQTNDKDNDHDGPDSKSLEPVVSVSNLHELEDERILALSRVEVPSADILSAGAEASRSTVDPDPKPLEPVDSVSNSDQLKDEKILPLSNAHIPSASPESPRATAEPDVKSLEPVDSVSNLDELKDGKLLPMSNAEIPSDTPSASAEAPTSTVDSDPKPLEPVDSVSNLDELEDGKILPLSNPQIPSASPEAPRATVEPDVKSLKPVDSVSDLDELRVEKLLPLSNAEIPSPSIDAPSVTAETQRLTVNPGPKPLGPVDSVSNSDELNDEKILTLSSAEIPSSETPGEESLQPVDYVKNSGELEAVRSTSEVGGSNNLVQNKLLAELNEVTSTEASEILTDRPEDSASVLPTVNPLEEPNVGETPKNQNAAIASQQQLSPSSKKSVDELDCGSLGAIFDGSDEWTVVDCVERESDSNSHSDDEKSNDREGSSTLNSPGYSGGRRSRDRFKEADRVRRAERHERRSGNRAYSPARNRYDNSERKNAPYHKSPPPSKPYSRSSHRSGWDRSSHSTPIRSNPKLEPDLTSLFERTPTNFVLIRPDFATPLLGIHKQLLFRFLRTANSTFVKIITSVSADCGAPYDHFHVIFSTPEQAIAWTNLNKGRIVFDKRGYRSRFFLHFSSGNWKCQNCNKINFTLRSLCFSCCQHKSGGFSPVKLVANPTRSVVIYKLPMYATEESVLDSFLNQAQLLSIKSVRIVNDPAMKCSSGVCLFDTECVTVAMHLFKLASERYNSTSYAEIQSESEAPAARPMKPDGHGLWTYPEPNFTSFQFEPISGFQYDPNTQLYYDTKSCLFYNSDLRIYLKWDQATFKYLPVQ